MNMTEQEARDTMKLHGWSYLPRVRGSQHYIYAQRKEAGRKVERYICPLAALTRMSIEQLAHKLKS